MTSDLMSGVMASQWYVLLWLCAAALTVCWVFQSEMALGKFPYPAWKTVFDQLKSVVEGDPPKLPDDDPRFSDNFKDLIHKWYRLRSG